MQNSALKKLGFVLGPLLFTLILLFFHPEGLSKEANAVLATTLWVAVWWIFEVVPIAVTALLPIILFPITGAMKLSVTTASFGHKYVFLYIGGFILAVIGIISAIIIIGAVSVYSEFDQNSVSDYVDSEITPESENKGIKHSIELSDGISMSARP